MDYPKILGSAAPIKTMQQAYQDNRGTGLPAGFNVQVANAMPQQSLQAGEAGKKTIKAVSFQSGNFRSAFEDTPTTLEGNQAKKGYTGGTL